MVFASDFFFSFTSFFAFLVLWVVSISIKHNPSNVFQFFYCRILWSSSIQTCILSSIPRPVGNSLSLHGVLYISVAGYIFKVVDFGVVYFKCSWFWDCFGKLILGLILGLLASGPHCHVSHNVVISPCFQKAHVEQQATECLPRTPCYFQRVWIFVMIIWGYQFLFWLSWFLKWANLLYTVTTFCIWVTVSIIVNGFGIICSWLWGCFWITLFQVLYA